MNRLLSDYLEICSKFRTNGLSKLERKQRHVLLSEWEKTDYEKGLLTLREIKDFWDNHNDICWNRVFINKVICPAIAADLKTGGYDGLRFCSTVSEDMKVPAYTLTVRSQFFVFTAGEIINRFSWRICCLNMNRIMSMPSDTSMMLSNIFLSFPYMKCHREC